MSGAVRLGRRYRCSVCGAEVLVIRAASHALDPHCCNQSMEPREAVPIYRCAVCGSEVAVLRGEGQALQLSCCNEPMGLREATVPEAV